MATGRPLRIGVLGAARIAPRAVIQPAAVTGVAEIVAVAARDPARAAEYASEHGIAKVCADYEALIADPDVEAIYNALPPIRHADLSIAALQAGKPVLCEKPFCMDAAEAAAMVAAGREAGVLLMEAFHYRYHPVIARVLEIIGSGELGRLKTIEAVFTAPIKERPGEIRYDLSLGGGAIMDLGTYCLHWCRTAAGEEPVVTQASAVRGAGGVDLSTRASLKFPSGVTAEVYADMTRPVEARLTVVGEVGTLNVVNPMAPQMGSSLSVEGAKARTEEVSREPTYELQLRAFVDAVRSGVAPPTSGEDCIAQMRLLDAVRAASR